MLNKADAVGLSSWSQVRLSPCQDPEGSSVQKVATRFVPRLREACKAHFMAVLAQLLTLEASGKLEMLLTLETF